TMATYVLVHGAYQGGWIWKRVVERLRAAGHQVHAPTLDGCAERHHLVRPGITVATHAQEIAQLLFYEDLARVVLVGTSSGGMVICKAAELARDRIARLVFVDALALMPGEQVGDIVKRVSANETTAITTGPARTDAEKRLLADLDPDLPAWALARHPPHPVAQCGARSRDVNGIHDMGGMHGFGRVEREKNEPVFHAPWEGRVLGISRACAAQHIFNIDESRHAIERMAPADYLRASYYER